VRRGVKEVGKSIRKGAKGMCIFAADVSPVDVLSHLPVQCETNDIPYIFIRSRLDLGNLILAPHSKNGILGIAASTKRPTSVVLLQTPTNEALESKYGKIMKRIRKINPHF
jgi:H/ACA ribonucleoprotein complex subunit 2